MYPDGGTVIGQALRPLDGLGVGSLDLPVWREQKLGTRRFPRSVEDVEHAFQVELLGWPAQAAAWVACSRLCRAIHCMRD